MGNINSGKYFVTSPIIMQQLPASQIEKNKILEAFSMDEIKLIYQIYNNIILWSK